LKAGIDFFSESEEISTPPPCGFLIGIYLFYENRSTETFRENESNRWAGYNTYNSSLTALLSGGRLRVERYDND
jgi:hypothetical protein